jgi:hypothetical protein
MSDRIVERLRVAERFGWCNFEDFGYGLQPVGRFIGDGLGPLPRGPARLSEMPRRVAKLKEPR